MMLKTLLAAGLLAAMSGCVTAQDAECDDEGCAAIGDVADLGAVSVTPLEVIEDSRCPVDAQCIQAGTVRVRTRVERGSAEQTIELEPGKPVPAMSGMLVMTAVQPGRMADETIDPAAYRFTFQWTPHLLDDPIRTNSPGAATF
ncbi:hypothetical protein [Aurantiacibacter spongiae]|uniref:Uncharacterized protein n=1 Tax=Aurantiacibacter spongiae TaxID=2488860 RepID=A0A3N5CQ44_9SPHN|nr:hypothetical protein [Aurantiacibacter spongiae]RPF70486.1 hypothetical protein EG799_01725 [Aurantiacibacter spongiae]